MVICHQIHCPAIQMTWLQMLQLWIPMTHQNQTQQHPVLAQERHPPIPSRVRGTASGGGGTGTISSSSETPKLYFGLSQYGSLPPTLAFILSTFSGQVTVHVFKSGIGSRLKVSKVWHQLQPCPNLRICPGAERCCQTAPLCVAWDRRRQKIKWKMKSLGGIRGSG